MAVVKVTSSSNGVLVGNYRITRVRLVSGTDAATAIIYDNATAQSGTEIVRLAVNSAKSSDGESWKVDEGMVTQNGISVTLTGTNPVLFIYYS